MELVLDLGWRINGFGNTMLDFSVSSGKKPSESVSDPEKSSPEIGILNQNLVPFPHSLSNLIPSSLFANTLTKLFDIVKPRPAPCGFISELHSNLENE